MSKLYHINSAYSLVKTMYGFEPSTDDFEDLAMVAWQRIGNKHTRLYRYVGDTKNKELELPCNLVDIESVHIPLVDAQVTSSLSDYIMYDSVMVEHYIDAWKFMEDPLNQRGRYVKYKEGDEVLYFNRDYPRVMVVYHGVLADDQDGLPLINDKEMEAIAAFVAYRETYKDILRKRDMSKASMAILQDMKEDWLRRCNAARSIDHISQNDMDKILDIKTRWDRKNYNHNYVPIL